VQPVSIKNCIKGTLEKLNLHKVFRRQEVFGLWEKVCGEKIAGVTRTISLKDGTLYVAARDHIWAAELGNFSFNLIVRYNKLLKEELIKKIRFISKPTVFIKAKKKKKNLFLPESAPLRKRDRKKIDGIIEKVRDEKARELLERLLVGKYKYEGWQEKRGGVRCLQCGVLLEKGKEICFFCSSELESRSREKLGNMLSGLPWLSYDRASKIITPLSREMYLDVRIKKINDLFREITRMMEKMDRSRIDGVKDKIVTLAMMKTCKGPSELKDDIFAGAVPLFMYRFYKGGSFSGDNR